MWIVIPSACAAAAAVRFEASAFIAHLVDHIPDKGQVLQRYCGYYANRTRGVRLKAQEAEDAMRVADVAGDAHDAGNGKGSGARLAAIVVMALFLTNALDRSSLAVYLLRALKERDPRGR